MKPENNLQDISIKELFAKIINNWYYFLISLTLTMIFAYLFVKSRPMIFQSSGSMLVEDRSMDGNGNPKFMKDIGIFSTKNALQDEIGILKSRTMIAKTLKKLNTGISYFDEKWYYSKELSPDYAPFTISIDSTHNQLSYIPIYVFATEDKAVVKVKIEEGVGFIYDPATGDDISSINLEESEYLVSFGDTLNLPYLKFRIDANDYYPLSSESTYKFYINTLSDLILLYKSKLKIYPENDEANIVKMNFVGPFIDRNSKFIDELMTSYLSQAQREKNDVGLTTLEFIKKQISNLSDSLRGAENELESFRTEKEVIDIQSMTQLLQGQLASTESGILNAELKLSYFEFLDKNLKDRENKNTIPSPSVDQINDPLLRSLLQELANLSKEKTLLSFSATKNNPQLLLIEDQIERTKVALIENVQDRLGNLRLQIIDLNNSKRTIQAKINRLPTYEKQLNNINRNYASVNERYKHLTEKKSEAEIAMANQKSESRIIDDAYLTSKKPISPNKTVIFGLALILGLGLPLSVLIGKDLLDNRLFTQKDIEINTPIPILSTVLKNDQEDPTFAMTNPNSLLAESFRALRVRLKYLTESGEKKVLGVTSTWSGEGKSFCSANIAYTLANSNKKTIILDLDFRKPSQETYYPGHYGNGMTYYMLGTCMMPQIIYPTINKNLDFIPVGKSHPNPLDLLESDKLKKLIAKLRKKYDYIILDLPPIGQTTDYFMLKEFIDYTIYIVRQKYTNSTSLKQINDLYESDKVKNISIVINAVKNPNYFHYGEEYLSVSKYKGYGYDQ